MGFTLLELILVLTVISVVLALSVPSLRGFFASRQTADAAGMVLSLTKYARSQAVAQGQMYRLNINPQSNTCWLTAQLGGAFVSLDCEMGRRFRFPEGADVSLELDSPDPNRTYLQFRPNGRNEVASVVIKGRQGEVFLVDCPSATEPFRVISSSEAP